MNQADRVTSEPPPDDRADVLRLALVPGIGPRLRQALLAQFGSPAAVLKAAPSQLREVPGIGPKLSSEIARAADTIDAEEELDYCRQQGIEVLVEGDAGYPPPLRNLPDPPGVLFLRGPWLPRDQLAVAIVGSRHATRYGLDQAERLAASLARAGMTIVSGLARGIDAAAHRGCLAAGGRTVAVLAGGLTEIYPPEHAELAQQVAAQGVLLSETPPRMQPQSGMFPQRNRLISGLSLGVLVVEAAQRSGALITVRHAVEQNRDVFAVPGRIDNRMARGCHQLIRDGATLVESADDLLQQLGHLVEAAQWDDGRQIQHPAELSLTEVERRVLDQVGADATPLERVIEQVGLPTSQVLAAVSALEVRRLIRRSAGGQVCRV